MQPLWNLQSRRHAILSQHPSLDVALDQLFAQPRSRGMHAGAQMSFAEPQAFLMICETVEFAYSHLLANSPATDAR